MPIAIAPLPIRPTTAHHRRSNGIYDRTTGEVVAQGELGLPIFVGVMQFTTQAVIERRRDLEPGDVILVNDPYLGGTHLMDVKMVRPFYYRGRLWCYLSNTGHWPDTGGMVPGGFSATATEIVQEGLRLPPVKLVRRGEICQDIIDIVLNNIRVAEERIGDIRAQLGALSKTEPLQAAAPEHPEPARLAQHDLADEIA
jgi:N-methylhydantoinase B